MTKLYMTGFWIEAIGAVCVLLFPAMFLISFKKRFLILSVISFILLIWGFYLTLL